MENLSEQSEKSKPNHSLTEVLEFCQTHDLPARVVGKWVWVKFDSKPPEVTRQLLKDFGFRWSRRRGQWSHNCGTPTKPAHSYKPWDKYRTVSIEEAYVNAGMGVTA